MPHLVARPPETSLRLVGAHRDPMACFGMLARLTRLTLLTLLTLPGCRDKPATPAPPTDPALSWTDDLGRELRLKRPARRVVSLSPALTEILFAVGCGHTLVLRDAWSDYPPQALSCPAIEGFVPSAEAILSMAPDLLLTSYPPVALQGALRGAGIPWAAFSPVQLNEISKTFAQIGAACGQRIRGVGLQRAFDAEVRRIQAAVRDLPRPRVFYEMDAGHGGRPFTVGPGSFGHALIEAAGGINIFEDSKQPWLQISSEAIIAAHPDVIVLADALAIEHPQDPSSVGQRPGWDAIKAVQRGRIYALNTDWVARPGPRLQLGLRQLAELLHPGALDTAQGKAQEATP